MFETFKVVQAKNYVIIDLIGHGLLDKSVGNLMQQIAGNPANKNYAKMALKQGAVKCKYTAAAIVFARLAVYCARSQPDGLTEKEWKLACRHALALAGENPEEVSALMTELIAMNKKVENQESP